jgi:hypothetical protein
MMGWLHNWGYGEQIPIDEVYDRLVALEQKYYGALEDIRRLEEENIETTNVLYELMENIRAVDARIDIVAEQLANDTSKSY